jgi:transcriptional regulator with PAS, ATPase and Fis domain
MQALATHPWPGNVRELENLIERGVILAAQDGPIELEHVFPEAPEPQRQAGLGPQGRLADVDSREQRDLLDRVLDCGMSLDQLEQRVLEAAVSAAGGNLSAAARRLGITRPQLAYRLKRAAEASGSPAAADPA